MPGCPRVLVHIGLPKTGTTYLQELLWHNRNALAAEGLLYPGYVHSAHFHASVDLLADLYQDWHEPLVAGAWDRLIEHVRSWSGTSVITSELLAPAAPAQIERVLGDLSFAEVHIVCTVRDLARQIPSGWQENVRNRHVEDFGQFLAAIRADEPNPLGELFWRYQDLPRVLSAWTRQVPAERVHVITVPRGGSRSLLWQRFAELLGVSPDVASSGVDYDNASLGAPDTEVLRRLNLALPREVGWPQYASVVKEYLATKILPRQGRASRIVLPAADLTWVARRAAEFTRYLTDAGFRVHGELDDLLPGGGGCAQPSEPTDGDLLDVAVDALAQLVRQLPANPDRDRPGERLKSSLREFSEQHKPAMALRKLYWKGKAQVSWGRRRPR